jgi:hypothetical protein
VGGELIGIVAGDLKHNELVGVEMPSGADLDLALQFGGAFKSLAAGVFTDCVPGLHGHDDEGVGVEAEWGAGAAESGPGGEGEVGDAVMIKIEMDQAGIFWNVNVRWSENNFGLGRLRESEQSDSGGGRGGSVVEQTFIKGA